MASTRSQNPGEPGSVHLTPPLLSSDGGKTLTFFNHDYEGAFQTVTFEGAHIHQLFYGSFHKVT